MAQKPFPYTIESDGVTVWVNSGIYCLGRFGRAGIDIHKAPDAEQSTGECLFCTHTWAKKTDWDLFVVKMLEFYGIKVPTKHMPVRLKENKHA